MKHSAADEAAMEALGRKVGKSLVSGSVLGLVGGLGAGKTQFSKGLAAGVGFEGRVTSPTFSLVHEYRGGKSTIFHFDFYRLDSAAALLEIGWDEVLDEGGIVIAEWADLHPEVMPEETRWLRFEICADGSRTVTDDAGVQ